MLPRAATIRIHHELQFGARIFPDHANMVLPERARADDGNPRHDASIPASGMRLHPDDRDLRGVGFRQQFLPIEHERAARIHRQRGRVRFDHRRQWFPARSPARRTANACRRDEALTSVSRFPSTRLAARRSIASVPSIASSATQARSAIATLWPRSRLASACAILRPYSMSRCSSESGFALRDRARRREQRLQQQRGIDQLNAFVRQHFRNRADQRIGILVQQRGE